MQRIAIICLSLATLGAYAQTTPAPLAFEVASIKPAPPPTEPGIRVSISQDKGRLTMSNVTLRDVIRQAYKTKEHQLTTPDWMGSMRFDIVAKLPEGGTKEQVPEMLQTLLVDRFKLTFHKESKTMPIYALVVAKGGPKLTEAEAEGRLMMRMSPKGRHMEGDATLARLAESLSNTLDRPVIDFTELKGNYRIDLDWSADETDRRSGPGPGGPGPGPGGPGGPVHGDLGDPKSADMPDAPPIFTAIQEKMGLKLEPRKAPADFIIVDSAEKVPTEN